MPSLAKPAFVTYNSGVMKKYMVPLLCALPLLALSCANAPARQLQYYPWHHTYSILFNPDSPTEGPQFRLALTLLRITYPPEQAAFLNSVLYAAGSMDGYRERLIARKRGEFRDAVSAAGGGDWHYAEYMDVLIRHKNGGIVIRRKMETVAGDKSLSQMRYYVVDLVALRRLRIDDFFHDFQGGSTREMVYGELRRHSGLAYMSPLSYAGFFSNYPELSFNFRISVDGIALRWDPGEIAPHSKGGIDLLIPWSAASPVLCCCSAEKLAVFGIYPG